jgi:hypothetical protein
VSYIIFDSRGYVDELATNTGWYNFAEWARNQGGELKTLGDEGASDDPKKLVEELLKTKASDEDDESVRVQLLDAAKRCEDVLIVSNGLVSDDTDDE